LAYTADSVDINDSNGMLGTCSLELTEIGGSYIMLENLFFRHDYEWTVEFFVKLVSLPGSTGTIITIGDFSLELTLEGYLIVNVSTENSTSTTLLSIDTWYHIAVVYTGDTNETYTLYINGDSDVTISADNVSLTSLTIGSNSLSIAGYISELRYSSCARYTESFTPPTEEFTIDDYTVVINHFNILDDFFGYNFLVSADMSNVIVSSNLITEQFIHSSLGLDVGSNLFIDLGGNLFTAGNLWIQNEANFASGINVNEGNIVIDSDGNIDFSGYLFNNGNLLWNATNNIIYNVDSNVGIGTNTPEYKLDVIGDSNISGNLLVGNIIAGNLIVNDTIIGTLATSAQPYITSLGNITSLEVNGNLTVGNLITSGAILGTLSTAIQPNITYLGSLSNLTVNGNATVDNLIANLVTSESIVGTMATAAQPNITYLGSLSNLTVSGNATVGNLVTSGAIVGTLATSAQPNITSIGTLTSLIVNGDITTTGSINGTLNITSLPNVTSLSTLSNLTVSGNATVGNLVTSGAIVGTLSTAAQPNITYVGSLSNLIVSGNATVGGNLTVSGNTTVSNLIVSKAMVGTLTTAAQPNITYVGTLSNLIVSGNTTVGGNLTVSGNTTVGNLVTSGAIVSSSTLHVIGTTKLLGNNSAGGIYITSNGYVGIGEAAPRYALDIAGSVHVAYGYNYKIANIEVLGYSYPGYTIIGNNNANGTLPTGSIGLAVAWNYTAGGREMALFNTDYSGSGFRFYQLTSSTAATNVLNISASGAMSVPGATTLSSTLGVTGNTTVGGNLIVSKTATAGNLTISGNATVSGNVDVSSYLNVLGSINLISSLVKTYTPTLTNSAAGLATNGTLYGYYMNLGGLKIAWGSIPLKNTGALTSYGSQTVSLPSSLFSSITCYTPAIQGVGNNASQFISGDGTTTTTFAFYIYVNNGGSTLTSCTVSFIVLGT